ncbi:coiled-coil domain-containing protein 130 homolog [Zootermopsis nevadensis]|uniref:coiled-coil domain-containing protein 130 homolog n=1 Tax=Zootermopsis nevadensis TaxID=136037 RepID=UPI000B8E79F7|nr:coiled-coil domain-containing protein 130 homolog [Zootermopsis nevadensis]
MGERKGTNHYYPPDYDPKKGGLNKFLGTHALRERAKKIGMGILIIRFEMPFNIWCNGCGNHIGMGVRYNAEKKRIGEYITTPIWSFRMRCHLCPNYIEIKTEPKTSEYIIVSGARRQENRWDPKENEQVVPEDKNTSKRLYDDAMFKLEHGYTDKSQAGAMQPTLAKLTAKRQKVWQDDYAANCVLRQQFRERSKELKARDAKDAALLQKSSLQINLLPETKEDRIKAAQLYIQAKKTPNKQKEFSDASLSCFDESSRGPNIDKESAENNLRKFTILGSVRLKSLDNKVSECKDTCIFDSGDVTTCPSKMDRGIATSDVIIDTSTCYKTSSENSELGSRNIQAVDSSLNTDNATRLKMDNSDPTSTKGSPDSLFLNSDTHISSSNISLVSHDYNFSCSDESSS